MVVNNRFYDTVYKKLTKSLELELSKYTSIKKYGGKVNHKRIKTLNSIYKYLNTIKESKYEYNRIPNLTEISNYLNK